MAPFLYALEMALSDRLRALREGAKLSGEALGDRLGVSKQTISHWEKGRYEPNVEQLVQLCSIFNASADWLVRGVKPGTVVQEVPFRDLSGFEVQLLTLFRMLDSDKQHQTLIALNDMVPGNHKASRADPFAAKRVGGRGRSRLAELDGAVDIDLTKKAAG